MREIRTDNPVAVFTLPFQHYPELGEEMTRLADMGAIDSCGIVWSSLATTVLERARVARMTSYEELWGQPGKGGWNRQQAGEFLDEHPEVEEQLIAAALAEEI